jgi:hypothetical protein
MSRSEDGSGNLCGLNESGVKRPSNRHYAYSLYPTQLKRVETRHTCSYKT